MHHPTAVLPHTSARPWWPWVFTFAAFPPVGFVAHAVAGPVDAPVAALVGGAVTGLGLGAAQWSLLRRRGIAARWIAATAAGLAVGLAAGAALVSYRVDRPSLALMGAVSGLAVGAAQAVVVGDLRRGVAWSLSTAALWALGWTVSATIGIDVEARWVVFGASGALVASVLQTVRVDAFVPALDGEAVA
ncbi:MAG TPA: hypothetical protein VHK88_12710 [Aquihabitans sp.]|nr:hypothetical protein [Aquihabitans sp.]